MYGLHGGALLDASDLRNRRLCDLDYRLTHFDGSRHIVPVTCSNTRKSQRRGQVERQLRGLPLLTVCQANPTLVTKTQESSSRRSVTFESTYHLSVVLNNVSKVPFWLVHVDQALVDDTGQWE